MSHLNVLSAGSTLHGVRACAALAAQPLGVEIEVATDHGHNISRAVLNRGAQADIVLIPAGIADPLTAQGLLTDTVALGTVGIGGVAREGANAPDISTMEALRVALIAADAVLLTRAPTGEHLLAVIAKLGLADEVATKLLRFDTSTKLNIDLASRSGNALGFGPETEIRAGKGVRWIGDVPEEIQIALPYVAAMLTNTNAKDAAQKFLAFLEMAQARKVFSNTGVKFSAA
jgi:molybdate transport system substrate-binding protein